jgi:hypothetical protein
MRPEQTKRRMDESDVERLNRITAQDPETLSDEDREFLSEIEDRESGRFLFGRYGMGYYTPENKAKADAARAERKKARELAAAQAAQAEAAAKASAAGGAT